MKYGKQTKKKRKEEVGRQLPTILEEAEKPKIAPKCNGGADVSNSFGNDGDRANRSWKPETNTEKMALNVEQGGCNDFIMDDLADVVEDERLEIREEQVKMVKFQGGGEAVKKRRSF